MSSDTLTILETDEIGSAKATYICSPAARIRSHTPSSEPSGLTQRIDIIPPSKQPSASASYWSTLLDVFLPVGYPHSVTEDYLEYQIYDSLQAFSSSIAGLLSSRAVLQGVGVGDATASPTAALLLNVLQESMGRIATIMFAHRLGTSLEPECKMYRLAADVLNDSALVLDCLSPVFPKPLRVGILSVSSVLRALCGVAAGSSKASLSAHFARWGNLGELNAKDSSQETVISLVGMLVGSLVVSYISSPWATWIALLFLLSVHMATNYAAVRAVNMTTLNRQRTNIVFSTLLDQNRILTPEQASKHERIFERDGILRSNDPFIILGSCQIGVPFQDLCLNSSPPDNNSGTQKHGTNSIPDMGFNMSALLEIFKDEQYILWFNPETRKGTVVLKTGVTARSQLKAWSHALIVSRHVMMTMASGDKGEDTVGDDKKKGLDSPASLLCILEETLQKHSEAFDGNVHRLKEAGWDVHTASLETKPGRRFEVS